MRKFKELYAGEFGCHNFVSFIKDDRDEWFIGPCGTNRDADAMTRANFKALVAALEEVDPEGNDHETHSFSHWAVGWTECVLIRPESEAFNVAERIEDGLNDYPVVDDTVYCEEENEDAEGLWRYWGTRERVQHIQRANKEYDSEVSIFAARRDEVPGGMYSYIRDLQP